MQRTAYVNTSQAPLSIRDNPNGALVGFPLSRGAQITVYGPSAFVGNQAWAAITPNRNRWVAEESLVYAKYAAIVDTLGEPLAVHNAPNGKLINYLPNGSQVYGFSDGVMAGEVIWVAIGLDRWVINTFLKPVVAMSNVRVNDSSHE